LRTASSPSSTVIAEAPYSSCAFFFWAATVGMLSLGFHAGGSSHRISRMPPVYRDEASVPILWARFYPAKRAVRAISLFPPCPDVHQGASRRPSGFERPVGEGVLGDRRRRSRR
jgi:hypothetical protein